MVTISLYLDARGLDEERSAPIKIRITKKRTTAYIGTDIRINAKNWDNKKKKIINDSRAARMNIALSKKLTEIETIVLQLSESGHTARLNAAEIKREIQRILNPIEENENTFYNYFLSFQKRCKAQRTKEIYSNTLYKMELFDKNLRSYSFENITRKWLSEFELWLSVKRSNKINTISIDLRNIRAVFNDAIDNEVTVFYPFRKKSIKNEETKKRSLSVEQLRTLFMIENNRHVDLFKLCFILIGINLVDLCSLYTITDNRITYKRAKTGKFYSIKVENEAMEIITRHRGETHLLDFAERYSDYTTLTKKVDKELKKFFPNLSLYWARHSWATVAASLDIPNETIAAALGHGYGNRITAIYIDFDRRKVDEANRKVLDWVFYGKK